MKRLPWWAWLIAAVVLAALGAVFVFVPMWRVEASGAALTGAAALARLVFGRGGTERRAARDRASEAVEEYHEAAQEEARATEERQERVRERAEEASESVLMTEPPKTPEERERRLRALGDDPLA